MSELLPPGRKRLRARCHEESPWTVSLEQRPDLKGDFNEILFGYEKEGDNIRPQRCMQAFRDVLEECGLQDLGYCGDIFTWRRGKIRERLDRAVSNKKWVDLLPLFGVVNEDFGKSDHRPITVDTE
jgi:hypothetical protein